MIIMESSVKIC